LRKQVRDLREGAHAASRAECALGQYWSLLDAIISGPGDFYAVKGTGYRYQAASQAFCRLVGLPEHEIRGRGDFDIFPNRLADIFHRGDVRVVQAAAASQYETRVVLGEQTRWFRIQKRPILAGDGTCAGVLAIFDEITDHARLRDQSRILAHAGNRGYWCTDVHGYILDVNHAYCAMTGYNPAELLGKNVLEIEMMNTPEALASARERAERDGTGACRTLHRTKSNRILEFEVDIVFVREHGGRFYRYFHPAATASSGEGVEAPDPAAAARRPALQTPHRKVINLNQLVILAIDREIDQIPPGISIRKKLDPALKNTMANQSQILQVILNITTNAVEAMDGRGHLTFVTRNVTLTRDWLVDIPEAQPGAYVYLAISDTGRGINAGLTKKIFDPFITTKFKGRGMGLASVSRNVAEHHGLVTVKSEPGKGSTFTIYLPATEAPLELGTRALQIPAGTETILFVDPESRVLEEGRRILESLAYTVHLTSTVADAIAHVAAAAPPIDMVVIDTAATLAHAGDFIAAFRQANPTIKIILAGAHELDTWAQDLLDAGVHGYVKKPFRAETLAPKIRQTLDSEW